MLVFFLLLISDLSVIQCCYKLFLSIGLVLWFSEGAMPASEIAQLNEELAGICYVVCTNRSSHMWDGEMCIKFLYEFMTPCLKAKRKRLKLTHKDRAMGICDRAGVHLHRQFLVMRQIWGEKENCDLFGADPDAIPSESVPAKIGATGSPNDGWHQYMHMIRRMRERICFSFSRLSQRFCLM